MHTTEFLTQVHDLALRLGDILPKPKTEQKYCEQIADLIPLNFVVPTLDRLRADLSTFNVQHDTQKTLVDLYLDKTNRLGQLYQVQYQKTTAALQRSGGHDVAYLRSFREVLLRRFDTHILTIWNIILEEAAKRHQGVFKDRNADEVEQGASPALWSAEPTTRSSRGHDSDAVRILEQAFQHTPNITQAEKYRLAEVTGLRPKQVTIWFQNRRNRKAKKAVVRSSVTPPQIFRSLPKPPSTPTSPTHSFPFGEKKRKNYGAIGLSTPTSPSSSTFSDGDELSLPKKLRQPRSASGMSDASATSAELNLSFTTWSSPSSRSTSFSSTSSSPSDCFDSPSRGGNVFRWTNPKNYEKRANQAMPQVTITVPSFANIQSRTPGQKSPFTSDNVNGDNFMGQQKMEEQGMMKFGDIQLDTDALQRNLRESIHKAFDLHAVNQNYGRTASNGWWASSMAPSVDDDAEWVDEDAAPARPSNFGVGMGEQHVATAPSSSYASSQQPSSWNSTPGLTSSGETSFDSNPSYTQDSPDFDLKQFFEVASQPSASSSQHAPSSSPFPQSSQHNNNNDVQIETPSNCPDILFDVDMADLQNLFDPSFLMPDFPVPAAGNEGREAGSTNEAPGQDIGEESDAAAAAQFTMNFEVWPQDFNVQ
nr:TPA_inf: bW [Pseudozyma tsukubaensis]